MAIAPRMATWAASIPAGEIALRGELALPTQPAGLVLFAHGHGAGRQNPRNRHVAAALHESGLGTLLADLLTPAEAEERGRAVDVDLLALRLAAAVAWCRHTPQLRDLGIGLYGGSTGAAVALRAAADPQTAVGAVVCRGGRIDLADHSIPAVTAPTLLIVGGDDWNVLEINDDALALFGGQAELAVVPHAGHLFEQPGALDEAARLAGAWFTRHLSGV